MLLLGAAGGAWIAIGALTVADARREIDAVLDAHLVQAATLLAARARHDIDESESESESEHADHDDGHPYANQVTFQLWNESGQLLRRSSGAPAAALTPVADGFDDPVIDGKPWRSFSMRAHGLVVKVAEGRAGRERMAQRFVEHTLWPLLAAIPLFGLLVWIAVSRALRPLTLLGDDLRRRRASDLGPVAVAQVPDEVAPLVAQLDELFSRIRDRLESERRFTSDAAHELRTPIAGIRAQAESALAAPDSAARDVVADLAPQAHAAGIDLGLAAVDDVTVRAEPLLVEVMVRNLVDNAMRYAGRGASIDVGVVLDGAMTTLVVTDNGTGLPAADLARLGQPFFRASQPSGSGTGLGLSIVARIAERHGGVVQSLPGPGNRGLRVRVSLPR